MANPEPAAPGGTITGGRDIGRDDKAAEAVELLREGIGRIGANYGGDRLVTMQAAVIGNAGDHRTAREILVAEALTSPRHTGRFAEQALLMAFGAQELTLLDDTAKALEPVVVESPGTRNLIECLVFQLHDDWADAAAVPAELGKASYGTLLGEKAFSALCVGNYDAVVTFVEQQRERRGTSAVRNWMMAVIAQQRGDNAAAHRHLESFVGRTLTPEERSDELLWVRVWRQDQDFGVRPTFYFPRLPSVLTGLAVDVTMQNYDEVVRPGYR